MGGQPAHRDPRALAGEQPRDECRLASTTPDGKAVELAHVTSLIRAGDRGIKCHFGIAGDAEAATAVCRSLRRWRGGGVTPRG